MRKNRGFTLIELLVVIAIIGILASVVLASLNSARAKGSDAAIKSSINNARAQAEIYYDSQTPNTYVGMCASASGLLPMLTAANNANGTGNADCNEAAGAWAMAAQLVSIPGSYYCVDSTGAARTNVGVIGGAFGAAATVCP
jgi:prepilin-type N-terminal cleavage/methylation domain-containing protein